MYVKPSEGEWVRKGDVIGACLRRVSVGGAILFSTLAKHLARRLQLRSSTYLACSLTALLRPKMASLSGRVRTL
jgi:hypothetical protein